MNLSPKLWRITVALLAGTMRVIAYTSEAQIARLYLPAKTHGSSDEGCSSTFAEPL